jgi:hypothetical protein
MKHLRWRIWKTAAGESAMLVHLECRGTRRRAQIHDTPRMLCFATFAEITRRINRGVISPARS